MSSLENGLPPRTAAERPQARELASRAGISRQTLSALEAGRAQPSTAIALNLARALGCRMEELFLAAGRGRHDPGAAGRSPARSAARIRGLVAGRWIAHPLRTDDPFALLLRRTLC